MKSKGKSLEPVFNQRIKLKLNLFFALYYTHTIVPNMHPATHQSL